MGLEVSDYLTVDDTGARHQGKNGYTTQLGNEHFAWFESTQTKDRISFLSLLNDRAPSYVINAQALQYMEEQKLPKGPREQKKYQQAPSAEKKAELDRRFDEIFTTKTRFETLNQVLKRLHRNKSSDCSGVPGVNLPPGDV